MSVTLEDCKIVISRLTGTKCYVNNFTIYPISDEPMGFLGDHYKLNINYNNGDKNYKTTLFLKCIPQGNASHMEYIHGIGVFEKEALLYKNLMGEFQKFHEEPIAPLCYLVNPDKFIVLEDLSAEGYYVRNEDLSLNELKSVMKTMARLHASTVIFETKNAYELKTKGGYKLNEFYQAELKEATFVDRVEHPRYKWARNTGKAIADSMKLLPGYICRNEGKKLMEFITEDICKFARPSDKYKNVLSHADLWRNNIMFKQNGGEVDCVFVDFQLARYAPPAFDILTTLYINSTEKFLQENLRDLVETYYAVLSGCLKLHGINCDVIMSHDEFIESLETYKLPALIEATMFATIIFVSPELSYDMLHDEDVFQEFTFNNRSKYVINEFIENPSFKEKYTNVLRQLVKCIRNYM